LVSKAQAILRQDKISVEDRATYDHTMAAAEALVSQIQNEERSTVETVYETRHVIDNFGARRESKAEQEYRMSFVRAMRLGLDRVSQGDRQRLVEHRTVDSQGQFAGTQSISYSEGTAGGFLVPAGFMFEIDQRKKYYAPMLDGNICRVISTETGAVLPFPTGDDTGNVATVVGENTQVSELPVSVGSIPLGAYKLTSQVVRVSVELLQDSAFNFDAYLMDRFAERFGRGEEAYFTTGSGAGVPTGILTAAQTNGSPYVVGIGSNQNDGLGQAAYGTIGSSDIFSLIGAVDPAYRVNGKFMLNDVTLTALKKVLDKYGRPLWVPGLTSDAPDRLGGYPFVINQSMPIAAPTTNPTTMIFGDFSHFVIRRVRDMSVLRLQERYADID
jgi:HK97 family phage major capsid protein